MAKKRKDLLLNDYYFKIQNGEEERERNGECRGTTGKTTLFIAYVDNYLPEWKRLKNWLNELPESHVEWGF